MDVPLSAVIPIVGVCLTIVGALIILNLKSIKECLRNLTGRTDKQDTKIEKLSGNVEGLSGSIADCKVDCERRFVNSELFLRETGFQRRALETQSQTLSRMEGKLTVVDKMPQIAGDIARAVVKEMKNGEPQ